MITMLIVTIEEMVEIKILVDAVDGDT